MTALSSTTKAFCDGSDVSGLLAEDEPGRVSRDVEFEGVAPEGAPAAAWHRPHRSKIVPEALRQRVHSTMHRCDGEQNPFQRG